jgi:cyclic-di-GMP phosphodiesterase, flagellum assembly factor TipF
VTGTAAGLRTAEGFVEAPRNDSNPTQREPRVLMTQQFAVPDDSPPHNPRYGDAFVVFSVTVLSCAIGAWLLLRLDLALWMGSVAALGVYATLLSFHMLVRRSIVAAEPPVAVAPAVGKRMRHPPAPPLLRRAPQPDPRQEGGIDRLPSPSAEAARWAETAITEPRLPPDELPQPQPADPFNFRPSREPSLSYAGVTPNSAPPLTAGEPKANQLPGLPDASQPEMSVELIQELIKKLADELNTSTGSASTSEPGPGADAMIGRSVEALQTAARTMHAPAGRAGTEAPSGEPAAPAGRVPAWWPTRSEPGPEMVAPVPGAPPHLNPQLARIAEAVAAERMEVLLEPIHALVEGRPRHFEVSMRLLTADGAALDHREYARAAVGSGLMPRIDAAKMVRAARVAGRLGRRGREGAVLATMAGDSLTDQAFLDAAAAGPGNGATMGLVLSFAQAEVRTFTPAHIRALGGLAAIGFRFALEDVTDLDMDFAALKAMGFAFVELDAPVFLDGLPAPEGRVPASDLCRHLAGFGLSLIVGHIEDDWLLARILGFGVLFGKGTLFGGPRQVKDEVVAGPAAA